MKKMLILFCIIPLCCLIYFKTFTIDLNNKTQSLKNAQIQTINNQYNDKLPQPKTFPKHLKSYIELSADGYNLNICTNTFNNIPIVYEEKEKHIYHTSNCQYYKEISNGDYSRPYWLSDVIMKDIRCILCIDDKLYYQYREAIYISNLSDISEKNRIYECIIKIIFIVIIISILIIVIIGSVKETFFTSKH